MRLRPFTYFFAVFMVLTIGAAAQSSQPNSLCADVGATGEVTLTWQYDDAIPGTTIYDIYRSEDAGFGVLPIDNTTDLFYTDPMAMANQDSVRYYIVDRFSSGAVQPADTISTIFLELIPTGTSSVAQLEWNLPFDPMPLGGQFIVERSQITEPFETIAFLPPTTTTYLDTLYSVCELTGFTYRVRYNLESCSMVSNESLGEYEDDEGPEAPVVETITVDPVTGQVTIYWESSNVPDLAAYIIQDFDLSDSTFTRIDSISGDSSSYSVDLSASSVPVTWVVLALDSCGNENSFDQQHTTMEVNVTYADCENFATLDWTPYGGWGDELEGYEIWAIVGQDTILMADSLGPDAFISNVDVEPNTEYLFYIKAISSGEQQASTSNGVVILTEYPIQADIPYLSSVSTNLSNQIEVTLLQDTLGVGTTYELYKKEGESDYSFIGLFPAIPGEDTITYIDSDVRANQAVYTYFWTAVDGCGQTLGDSNEGSNMLLTSRSSSNDFVNRLDWTEYLNWDGNVIEYRILRALGDEDPVFYAVTDPFATEWSEDVEEFMMNEGRFCYRIQAIESSNQYGSGANAFSNTSCITQEPIIWVPNAMVYQGFNDQFKPVLGFVDFETYRMEIYNKWGELLFETSDFQIGWDGTYSGSVVPEDYYRYIITAKDGGGKPIIEEGVLYMVRNAE